MFIIMNHTQRSSVLVPHSRLPAGTQQCIEEYLIACLCTLFHKLYESRDNPQVLLGVVMVNLDVHPANTGMHNSTHRAVHQMPAVHPI